MVARLVRPLATPIASALVLSLVFVLGSAGCGSGGGSGGDVADAMGGIDSGGGGGGADGTAPGDGTTVDTAAQDNSPVPLGDGHRLFNVAADFVAYGEAGAALDAGARAALWDDRLEARYPDFFAAAIYRDLEGAERDAWKAQVIDQFWSDVAPRLADLRALSETAPQLVLDGRAAFLETFPDFAPDCDYYLTVAFSFHGKVLQVGDGNIFALGLENFAPGEPELAITIAHEQFHLHHFATFSASGGLYRGVWAEGLASWASAMIVPGYRMSQYLGFTGARMNECSDLFDQLRDDILANMSSTDQILKRAYLGVEENETWIPPGAGYYVGFVLAQTLADTNDLAAMTRWDADSVYHTMEQTLPTLQGP